MQRDSSLGGHWASYSFRASDVQWVAHYPDANWKVELSAASASARDAAGREYQYRGQDTFVVNGELPDVIAAIASEQGLRKEAAQTLFVAARRRQAMSNLRSDLHDFVYIDPRKVAGIERGNAGTTLVSFMYGGRYEVFEELEDFKKKCESSKTAIGMPASHGACLHTRPVFGCPHCIEKASSVQPVPKSQFRCRMGHDRLTFGCSACAELGRANKGGDTM